MWRMSDSVNLPHFKYVSFVILEKRTCVVVSRNDLYYRIQDFLDRGGGGANPWVWTKNLLLDKIFAETAWKWKKLDLEGRASLVPHPTLDPPMIRIPYYRP